MGFIEAAKEIGSWVVTHPIDDALCSAAALIISFGSFMKFREYRAERKAVNEILSKRPIIKDYKLPPLDVPFR